MQNRRYEPPLASIRACSKHLWAKVDESTYLRDHNYCASGDGDLCATRRRHPTREAVDLKHRGLSGFDVATNVGEIYAD